MPQTIALVDDDRNILTSVAMTLEAEGFIVRVFSDGAEALKGLTAQPVDLAILDIKMSRMTASSFAIGRGDSPVTLTSKDDEVDESWACAGRRRSSRSPSPSAPHQRIGLLRR